ncbi:lipoprotein [Spiroplasma endosymbiont of Glossina fuscipes fuscipes]|uniref:lipoprotein n=1 Tax=Spiroplasma endosymbiont of Glossina fuscipes fuscipes TaxID=2004463 RepID=UPI003C763564
MKKWLSILGTIGLTATSTTTLISCEKPNNNENGGNKPKPWNPQQPPIGSNWKLINKEDININHDNKNYFAVVRIMNGWKIIKWKGELSYEDRFYYFKNIYRWDGLNEPQIPEINTNTGEILDWKE